MVSHEFLGNKEVVLYLQIDRVKLFIITYPPVASNVYQNMYFLFKKIQTDTNKRQKELKNKTEKQKKPKKKRRKEMLLLWAVSEKYNGIQWYRLRISQFLLVSWNCRLGLVFYQSQPAIGVVLVSLLLTFNVIHTSF